jgi:aldehyde:ferredoxin oxidoreductase
MALAYGTSSIGAHHKDAWAITWEMRFGREKSVTEKVDFLIKTQLTRGGLFEALGVCRLAYNSLGLELEWYCKYLKAATGIDFTLEQLNTISDRILNLIRAFWVREYGANWSRQLDMPPSRWFNEPLKEGKLAGSHLNIEEYNNLLSNYYQKRGWNQNGVPEKSTMARLGIEKEAEELKLAD